MGIADIERDLKPFKLSPGDLDARALTQIDLELLGLGPIVGYRVPYYDFNGLPVKHSRVRQCSNPHVKGDNGAFIRTTKDEARIYFPMEFRAALSGGAQIHVGGGHEPTVTHRPLILVDDERVATHIVVHHGYPAAAVQGPAGWSTHSGLADGFKELCELVVDDGMSVVLWIGDGSDRNIQREVANLAMELKFRGVPFNAIRQYTLDRLTKAGLAAVLTPRSKFPQHPNIRSYIQEKIGDSGFKLTRKDHMEVALAILADMESRGIRIKSTTDGNFYYFNRGTRELLRTSVALSGRELMDSSEFMSQIYTSYGISPNDTQILKWLATQFASEEPIYRTRSFRVMMCEPRHKNTFALQLSASEYVTFEPGRPARFTLNGEGGILFEKFGETAASMDMEKLKACVEKEREKETLRMWWLDVIKEVRIDKSTRFRMMLALLYYISPWLKGWREIQLPIEVITGEAGTGKSSLFSLRLKIITGDPELKGLPSTVRDWHTALANTSGISVFDNVHLANRQYRQALSDEMCRLVTEPRPTIEMRQLYKTAEVAKLPVNCTFGVTSIENVFTNIDFIQRSIILHLDRAYGGEVLYGSWVSQKLEQFGGREAWLAHHIVALERFFAEVERPGGWDVHYASRTRLINLEQAMVVMGRVFGVDCADWLPEIFQDNATSTAVDIDWVLKGLKQFADRLLSEGRSGFTAAQVVDWAMCEDEFEDNVTLTNARRLGRYIASHKTVVRQTTGINIARSNAKGTSYAIEVGGKKVTAAIGKSSPKGKKKS